METILIELFRAAAEAHTGISYFAHGSKDALFTNQPDLTPPAVLLQSLGATSPEPTRIQFDYAMYVMVEPVIASEVDGTEFEIDTRETVSRDTAFQITNDIIGEVALKNLGDFTFTVTGYALDNVDSDINGTTAWRTTFNISQDLQIINNEFPR